MKIMNYDRDAWKSFFFKDVWVCGWTHTHFPLPSLAAVVCVTVVTDNPFRSTWRLIWRNNSHGGVSLPFKIEMHPSAEFTAFSSSSGDWELLCKRNIWNATLTHMLWFDILYLLDSQNRLTDFTLLWQESVGIYLIGSCPFLSGLI